MRLATLGFLVIGGMARSLAAQSGVVALRVVDSASTAPIADVRVAIVGVDGERLTDAGGRHFYTAPRPGPVVFVLRRLGFSPGMLTVDVTAGDTSHVRFAMSVAPQWLGEVAVTDSMASTPWFLRGFEQRAANRLGGSYITRAEIEKRASAQTTDLLRRIPSLEIHDSAGVKHIHGIEVYPGAASVPTEFAALRRDAHCGVILIWTRVGN